MEARATETGVTGRSTSDIARLTLRSMLLAAVAAIAAGCGGGNSCQDQITIGASQSCSGGGDAVTQDFPIFYVKRPVPVLTPGMQPSNVLKLREFEPNSDLYMRASASPSATETNLTAALTKNLGDVRDVDVSWDGKKVVFAMRFPFKPNTQEQNQPASWDIYEYDIQAGTIRGVLVDPLRTNNNQPRYDDRFPHYLPDGRIVFSSNRQRFSQATLLDEGKQQYQAMDENNSEPAFLLHVMDAAGTNIRQISFNQSHDMDSAVLPNGQIVFSRWDGTTAQDAVSLYSVNPDGSKLELLYGRQPCSHLATNGNTSCTSATTTPIQFLSPRPLQNGRLMALVRPMTGTEDAGDLVSIEISNYVENTQATLPNVGVLNGPAQVRVSPIAISTEPNMGSPGGRYRSAYPLPDNSNRLLVSWSQCRVIENNNAVPCTSQRLDPSIVPPLPLAPPLFGIYIYDLNKNTQLPIVVPQEGIIYSDVVAASARTLPPVILDRVSGVDFAAELTTQGAGILDIKSVYDFDGVDLAPGSILGVRNGTVTAANRPARFLRIEKAVSLPSKTVRDIKNTSFGPTGRFMREILGYTPIEPDGSVRVKVPANVALELSIVDQNGRRVVTPTVGGYFSPTHRNWLQVAPGEVLSCNGCHTPQAATSANQRSHGRSNLFPSVNPGAPGNGQFPNSDSALLGNPGETMAQTRARTMCPLTHGGSACVPSVDILYDDFWTDSAARAKDASFDYCYTSGPTDVGSTVADFTIKHVCASKLDTPIPVRPGCETNWNGTCRVTINYVQHIQPLWDKPRPTGVGTVDNVCTTCHSSNNANPDAVLGSCQVLVNGVRVPCGQLDLTANADVDEPDHLTSYEKLLTAHNAQELNATMNALQDICRQLDPITGTCLQRQVINGSMVALNAVASRFFTVMSTAGGTVDHRPFMTDAEKRLISEWLDIGAQYYNDPFLAPVN
jgi:hypothetical protein